MAEIFKDLLRFCKILTDLHGWDSYQILEDLWWDLFKIFTRVKQVYKIFSEKTCEVQKTASVPSKNPESVSSNDFDFLADFNEYEVVNDSCNERVIDGEIDLEIHEYAKELRNINEKIEEMKSSTNYWLQNQSKFRKLSELYFLLNSIPASSAYIERFFSISGIVCDQKRMTMEDDLIIHRSMLKAKMKFLDILASIN